MDLLNNWNTLLSIKLVNDVKSLREMFAYFLNLEHIYGNIRYLRGGN